MEVVAQSGAVGFKIGGDAAGLFGPTAGTILSLSGYPGSFNGNFTSGPFQALADTFAQVSEPGTLALLVLGGGLLAMRRRGRRQDLAHRNS